MKILWLASWYPNELLPLNGDFVQRHAKAVSIYNEVTVINITRDKKKLITGSIKKTSFTAGQLKDKIIYYHTPSILPGTVERIISARKYNYLFKEAIAEYIRENGKPDLIHVHVAMNAGVVALWAKKKYNIPYVVTEHWSGLLQEAADNFNKKPVWFKTIWKKIISNALSVSVVSNYLKNAVTAIAPSINPVVIPNVVDTNLFLPVQHNTNETVTFIHVTRMDYQKNPEALWKAFSIVSKTTRRFKLIVYTSEKEKAESLNKMYSLSENIIINPEVPQPVLVADMQKADVLILFSRYETFGCVVAEANACGIPAIVSDIPVMHELVQEGVNGLFAVNDDAHSLAGKIFSFIENRNQFNKLQIAENASAKYNYREIGGQITQWYSKALKS